MCKGSDHNLFMEAFENILSYDNSLSIIYESNRISLLDKLH